MSTVVNASCGGARVCRVVEGSWRGRPWRARGREQHRCLRLRADQRAGRRHRRHHGRRGQGHGWRAWRRGANGSAGAVGPVGPSTPTGSCTGGCVPSSSDAGPGGTPGGQGDQAGPADRAAPAPAVLVRLRSGNERQREHGRGQRHDAGSCGQWRRGGRRRTVELRYASDGRTVSEASKVDTIPEARSSPEPEPEPAREPEPGQTRGRQSTSSSASSRGVGSASSSPPGTSSSTGAWRSSTSSGVTSTACRSSSATTREAQLSSKIRSQHVVRVHDVATDETIGPYIVMEYLEGEDLDKVLDRGTVGTPPPPSTTSCRHATRSPRRTPSASFTGI